MNPFPVNSDYIRSSVTGQLPPTPPAPIQARFRPDPDTISSPLKSHSEDHINSSNYLNGQLNTGTLDLKDRIVSPLNPQVGSPGLTPGRFRFDPAPVSSLFQSFSEDHISTSNYLNGQYNIGTLDIEDAIVSPVSA